MLFGLVLYIKKWLFNRGFIVNNVLDKYVKILYNKKLKWFYLIDVKNFVFFVLYINKIYSFGDLVVFFGI